MHSLTHPLSHVLLLLRSSFSCGKALCYRISPSSSTLCPVFGLSGPVVQQKTLDSPAPTPASSVPTQFALSPTSLPQPIIPPPHTTQNRLNYSRYHNHHHHTHHIILHPGPPLPALAVFPLRQEGKRKKKELLLLFNPQSIQPPKRGGEINIK